jgi:FAD/FMN-containing dehydrogenase
MDRIREVGPFSMGMSVDAGTILKNVHDAAATAVLLLPFSLGAEGSCWIGGMCGRFRFGKSFLHGFAALVVAAMCSAL